MKQLLLISALTVAGTLGLQAKTMFIPGLANSESGVVGPVTAVSQNGRFAVTCDETTYSSFLWDSEHPEDYNRIELDLDNVPYPEGENPKEVDLTRLMISAVSDDGTLVGKYYVKGGKYRPIVIRPDGEVMYLPVHAATHNTINIAAISGDGKYIAGDLMIKSNNDDPQNPIKGMHYACQWILNDKGEYDMNLYYPMDLPDHQGFMTYCQSQDGRMLAGFVHAGKTDCFLPALILDGELRLFNKLEDRLEPWYYEGEFKGYDMESYIDGYHDVDSANGFIGLFQYCDNAGYLYGGRHVATDVTPEGEGKLVHYASVYNYLTDEWVYETTDHEFFSAGMNGNIIFTESAKVIRPGMDDTTMTDALDFTNENKLKLAGATAISADGKTLGGSFLVLNPATMQYDQYPWMLCLDYSITEIAGIEFVGTAEDAVVVLSKGHIEVCNATDVTIFDLNGNVVSRNASADVEAGMYIVTADGKSRKVMVN